MQRLRTTIHRLRIKISFIRHQPYIIIKQHSIFAQSSYIIIEQFIIYVQSVYINYSKKFLAFLFNYAVGMNRKIISLLHKPLFTLAPSIIGIIDCKIIIIS